MAHGSTRIVYSKTYLADDGYEYCHVTTDPREASPRSAGRGRLWPRAAWERRGIELGPDWEHYAWHRPEPHIFLFRRRVPRRVVTCPQGTQTDPPERTDAMCQTTTPQGGTGGGLAPPVGGGLAPPVGGGVSPLTPSPPSPLRGSRLVPSPPPTPPPLPPATWPVRKGRLHLRWKGCVGIARRCRQIRRTLAQQPFAEPQAASPLGVVAGPAQLGSRAPLDEQLARKGLSPKLLMSGVPEAALARVALEAVAARVRDQALEVQVVTLSRAILILRGLRGYAGVDWAQGELLQAEQFELLSDTAMAGATTPKEWV